nr:MAG: RNA-dependent RNA polymerase [Totiviridae sp.]
MFGGSGKGALCPYAQGGPAFTTAVVREVENNWKPAEPDSAWSWSRFLKSIQKENAELIRKPQCDCSERARSEEPDFSKTLRRYRPSFEGCKCGYCGLFLTGPSPHGEAAHMLHQCAHPDERYTIRYYWGMITEWSKDLCRHDLLTAIKAATAMIKKGGSYITPHWKLMAYWEVWGGYRAYTTDEAIVDQTRKWLVTPHNNGGALFCETCYLVAMMEQWDKIFDQHWHKPAELVSLEEWAASGEWMQGKAGTGPKIDITLDGKRKRSRAYKGVESAYRTDAYQVEALKRASPDQIVVLQKSEGGKLRPVAKTGNEMCRRMDFLSTYIEAGFVGAPFSTLFKTGHQEWQDEISTMKLCTNSHLWKVPLDQSAFDNNQSRTVVEGLFRYLALRTAAQAPGGLGFQQVAQALTDALDEPIPISVAGTNLVWNNGMASGWRWTALGDTLINMASFKLIDSLVAPISSGLPATLGFCAMGDDVMFATPSLDHVNKIMTLYNILGYEVHPQKTYLSKLRTEFLRRNFDASGTGGYRARTLLSILWRSPILRDTPNPHMRLSTRIPQWLLFMQRGACPRNTVTHFVADCTQSGVRPDVAVSFSITPNSYGGLGVTHYSPAWPHLYRLWNKKWVSIKIMAPKKDVKGFFDLWDERIRSTKVGITHTTAEMKYALISSWGFAQAETTGRITATPSFFAPETPIIPLSTADPPPVIHQYTNRSDWPAPLRSKIAKELVDRGQYDLLFKTKAERDWLIPEMKRQSERMSGNMFRRWVLGTLTTPTPIGLNIDPSFYPAILSNKPHQILQRILAKDNLTYAYYQRASLWLERFIARKITDITCGNAFYATM